MQSGVRESVTRLRTLASPIAGTGRVAALDGVRGIAIILVFFVHFDAAFGSSMQHGATFRLLGWAGRYGNYGVDLFFVLSGWLLYRGLVHRPQPYGVFLWRRVRRLYPTFAVVFAVYVALSALLPEYSKLPSVGRFWYIVANLLLLPGIFPIAPLIAVAWSLSYEALFYLVVPGVARVLRSTTKSATSRLTVIAVVIVGVAISPLGCTVGRFLMFGVGMALADVTDIPPVVRRLVPLARVGVLAATVYLATTIVRAVRPEISMPELPILPCGIMTLLTGCVLAAAMLLAIEDTGWIAAVCRRPRMRWLGNISYSYYLIHGLTINALAYVLLTVGHIDKITAVWWLLPVVGATTAVTAFLLYAFVEYPWSVAPAAATATGDRTVTPVRL